MVKMRQGSYTVEATFIMIIVVGIIISMCFFVMKRHDDVVVASLTQYGLNEDGDSAGKKEERIRALLMHGLLLSTVDQVKVKKKIAGFQADVICHFQREEIRIQPYVVKLSPVRLMWDYTLAKAGGSSANNNTPFALQDEGGIR